MEFLVYMLIAAVAWYVISNTLQRMKLKADPNGGKKHCMTCGSEDVPKVVTKGGTLIELILWLCFIVPGLIYSIWRVGSRHGACAQCGSVTLVPIDSPAAATQRKAMAPENGR